MIHRVAGPDDPLVAPYAHVGDHAWLRERRLFVAEGRLVVRRLLDSRRFAIHSVLLTPAAEGALGDALHEGVPRLVAEPPVLQAVTGFNFHRGCLALAERPAPAPLESLFDAPRLVALEGVGNPDNVGGIFRVGAAFGAAGILLDGSCADPLYRKAVRTSMGAALEVPFVGVDALVPALDALRNAGSRILALTPREGATPIGDVPPQGRFVVVAGAEGAGLSEAALGAADMLVRIPTTSAVDSLNVTVAVGIALSRLSGLR